jgi:hypothetical protein
MSLEFQVHSTPRNKLFLTILSRLYGEILTPEDRAALLVAKTAGNSAEQMKIGQKIAAAGFTPETYFERMQEILAPLSDIEKDVTEVALGMRACGPTPTRAETARTVSRSIRSLSRIERRALNKVQAVQS